MFDPTRVSFGDNVRIVHDPSTVASGHAGLCGVCYGETTPSVTGVEVVGKPEDDYALNVSFEPADGVAAAWFDRRLVELVGHGAGTRVVIGDKAHVRAADGSWTPDPTPRRRWPWSWISERR